MRDWMRVVLVTGSRAYRAMLLALTAVALAPVLFGWSAHMIRTGSMEPYVGVGSVVVAKPLPATGNLNVGRVYVFTNPATNSDVPLVHRVAQRLADGTYVTAGDANEVTDVTPVERSGFRSQAILLAPYVGLPVTWYQSGDLVRLGLWLLLTMAAFVCALLPLTPNKTKPPTAPGAPSAGSADTLLVGSTGQPTDTATRLNITDAVQAIRSRVLRRPTRPTHGRAHARARYFAGVALLPVLVMALFIPAGGDRIANAAYTATTANGSIQWKAAAGYTQPYLTQVMADQPYLVHLLDEPTGTPWAPDHSNNGNTGQYTAISGYRNAGALSARNFGYSINPGDNGRIVSDGPAIAPSATYTLEAWFNTTSTTGGRLIGFGNSRDATSTTADRVLSMNTAGRLVYGAWVASPQKIMTTPTAYNNGQWHHVVLAVTPRSSGQDVNLYVDGAFVFTSNDATSRVANYTGWWRIGAGTRPVGVGGAATINGFRGLIDNVAIYNTALSAARVRAHYNAR